MVILVGLEIFLGRLGATLGPHESNLGRFGRPRGAKREAKRGPRRTKRGHHGIESELGDILGGSQANFQHFQDVGSQLPQLP